MFKKLQGFITTPRGPPLNPGFQNRDLKRDLFILRPFVFQHILSNSEHSSVYYTTFLFGPDFGTLGSMSPGLNFCQFTHLKKLTKTLKTNYSLQSYKIIQKMSLLYKKVTFSPHLLQNYLQNHSHNLKQK